MMAGPVQDSEFNFVCQQCPRTFKLQEFYEKHQKVHLLKKQHVCRVCGYVYGAAKGLEGHMEAAHGGEVASLSPQPAHFNNNNNSSKNNNTKSIEEVAQNLTNKPPTVRPKLSPSVPMDLSQAMPEMPFLHFLQAQGVLSSSDLLKQAQTAMLAQMSQAASNTRNLSQALSLHPITISAPTSPNQASPNSVLQQKPNDKSKIPSPAGTGNYKIYDEVPEIQDASDAAQNESGFFSCTICSREFSGLNSLKKHVPIHTRRVQHKCDTCGYVFGKKEYLLDHMRKHTGEISPVCEVCGQTFNKSLKLKEHLKLHRNTTHDGNLNDAVPYRCHICKQCFATPEPLGDHLRSAHSETVYKCDMCDATFGDVRGKNHHMYNEHQLDAFHQKCVWCPVCNQGFTRHYNLKVHMYKSHGKEYLENNFSAEELDAIMRPPPGSNTSKPSPTPRKRSDEEIVIPGTPTGVLPISPPLTPKLSPNNKKARSEDSPTMVPSNSVIPSANILKAKQNGKAGVAKPQHYFDQDAQHSMLQCQVCEEKFLRKTDLYIHLAGHGVRVIGCQLCDDKFLDVEDLKAHLAADHGHDSGDSDGEGAAGDSVSPPGTRGARPASSNLPSHLSGALGGGDSAGFPCHQCGKVLMHKQSYVSHMRVIHGDYYGGNKWQGSSVVEMVLGGHTNGAKRPLDGKQGNACEFCNKSFTDQHHLDNHIATKHPNLSKRIMAFKAALGLNDSDQPDSKRIKLDTKGTIFVDENENSLSSYSVLSVSAAHAAHLSQGQSSSSGDEDEPLDLACKPVSLNVDIDDDEMEAEHYPGHYYTSTTAASHSNNLLQIAQPLPPRASPPSSPLNLHVSRPATPSPPPPSASQQPSQEPSQGNSPSQQQQPQAAPSQANTQGVGTNNTSQTASSATPQPKLHEYLVKQNNATSDENGRKKFLCPVCKCQLSWKTNLSVHLRTHSGERPFQCVLCLNKFRQKAHLYKHFRCSHGNKVAPYRCSFCPQSFTRSPNDLYNHITEVHKRETDQLTNNNNVKSDIDIDTIHEDEEDRMEEESHNKTEEMHEEEESEPKDSEEEEVYEHRGKVFKRVLNFSPEESKSKKESEVGSEDDEEGQMVIDEARSPSSSPENLILSHRRSPPSPITKNNFNNNELKINNFGQGFANAINIWKEAEESQPQPTHTVKFEPLHHALYYPAAFPDFSLPFSLSGLIQKKRSEMAAILAPRLSPKSPREQHSPAKLTLDHLAKAAMVSKSSSLSPAKSDSGSSSNTAVSEYENQIQNDLWPIDCIKCNSTLTSLDNFNIHMNDHWSDDKCCPVCGLLINSKRFNFKQHLKIHTGEKPFVCQVCNRAFRQKAHMVKHVTTHRSEPRSMSDNLYGVKPGVIVQ